MPRKTVCGSVRSRKHEDASMRPRPDAAENAEAGLRLDLDLDASMRPRPDAAENGRRFRVGCSLGNASMRPRPDAAENPGWMDCASPTTRVLQ